MSHTRRRTARRERQWIANARLRFDRLRKRVTYGGRKGRSAARRINFPWLPTTLVRDPVLGRVIRYAVPPPNVMFDAADARELARRPGGLTLVDEALARGAIVFAGRRR